MPALSTAPTRRAATDAIVNHHLQRVAQASRNLQAAREVLAERRHELTEQCRALDVALGGLDADPESAIALQKLAVAAGELQLVVHRFQSEVATARAVEQRKREDAVAAAQRLQVLAAHDEPSPALPSLPALDDDVDLVFGAHGAATADTQEP